MTRRPPDYAPPWHATLTALLIELWRCIRPRPEPEPDPGTLSILFGFEQGPLDTHYQLFYLPPEFADTETVNARFRRFAEAYLTLSDPEKRAAYDLKLAWATGGHRHVLTRTPVDRPGLVGASPPATPPPLERLPQGADGLPPEFLQPCWGTPYQALRLHPQAGQDEVEARFRQMVEGYVTLSDPERRQAYNLELQVKAFRHDLAKLDLESEAGAAPAHGRPDGA